MAIVICGRCGKPWSDKAWPACPACGAQAGSAPQRPDTELGGTAPGEPRQPGSPWSPGQVLVGIAALGLVGWGVLQASGFLAPKPPAEHSGPGSAASGGDRASSGWADRVEAALQSMTVGQEGARMAETAMRQVHPDVAKAFLSGCSVSKVGKEAYVAISIMWTTSKGVACSTGIQWYISEARGHGHAEVSSDSSPDPLSPEDGKQLNYFFRNSVYPTLVRAMETLPGRLAPKPGRPRSRRSGG